MQRAVTEKMQELELDIMDLFEETPFKMEIFLQLLDLFVKEAMRAHRAQSETPEIKPRYMDGFDECVHNVEEILLTRPPMREIVSAFEELAAIRDI